MPKIYRIPLNILAAHRTPNSYDATCLNYDVEVMDYDTPMDAATGLLQELATQFKLSTLQNQHSTIIWDLFIHSRDIPFTSKSVTIDNYLFFISHLRLYEEEDTS